MAQIRANTVHPSRERVHATLRYAASFRSLEEEWHDCEDFNPKPKEGEILVDKKKMEAKRHRAEWCAAAMQYRCVRCGRGTEEMKM